MTFDAREKNTVKFKLGNGKTTDPIEVPSSICVTSPLRDIKIDFKTTPEFDESRSEVYFPSVRQDLAKFYPASKIVSLKDGKEFRFDDHNLITEVKGGELPHVSFEHPSYRDGPCVVPTSAEIANPHNRGPPSPVRLIDAQTRIVPQPSRRTEVPAAATQLRMIVRNRTNNSTMEVREINGRLLQVIKP
jgi:hypothetical protein